MKTNTILTEAEIKLSKNGFYLLNKDTVKIDDALSYPILEYARFMDDDRTLYDMVITLDASQNCIELRQKNSSTVFIEPELLEAIQERTKELNFGHKMMECNQQTACC